MVDFFAGGLGQPPGGFPEALQKKVLKGKPARITRPGLDLPDADLEAIRHELANDLDIEANDFELASYLMYPKVFTEFVKAQNLYGPTSVLPTNMYFYGLNDSDEVMLELRKGVTLVVRYLGHAEPNEKGQVRVFFELNGQPRAVSVPDRAVASTIVARPKADAGDTKQVGAPMPGVVSTLAVKAGQQVAAGDVLLSIEAMKMETAIHAEMDGVVAEVTVKAGDQIDAKDLLVRFE